MTNAMIAQVYALKSQIDALVLMVEHEVGVSRELPKEPGSCEKCGASPELVADTSTLDGVKRSKCGECGHEWER